MTAAPLADGDRIVEIVTTVGSDREAQDLVRSLVESRLVACGRWHAVRSAYRWKGRVDVDDECEVTLKTTSACAESAEALLRDRHRYEVPMILRIPVESVNDEYAEWVRSSCRPADADPGADAIGETGAPDDMEAR